MKISIVIPSYNRIEVIKKNEIEPNFTGLENWNVKSCFWK